jgi:hypothetical protein
MEGRDKKIIGYRYRMNAPPANFWRTAFFKNPYLSPDMREFINVTKSF